MLRSPYLFLPLAACVATASVAPAAESSDPDQIFLSAYMSCQAAEKLESQGNFKAALAKYRFAGSVLDQLEARTPGWNPPVLQFRKKKIADAITNLQERIAAEAPPAATPTPGLDTSLVPGINPNISPAPRGATGPDADSGNNGGGDAFDRAAREMRTQMANIKAQLEASRQKLESVQQEKARLARQLQETTGKLDQASTLSQDQAEKLRQTEAALKQQAERAAANEAAAKANNGNQKALQAQLEEAKVEAAKAKEQLTRAKTNESDLEAQLKTAGQQLETQQKQKDEAADAKAKEIAKQMQTLRNALEDAKADREVAEEQGELIHQRSIKLTRERDEATAKATQLATNLADAEKKLVAAAQEREAARAEAAAAGQKLAESQKQIQSVTTERDTALAQLAKAQEEKGKADKLLAENAVLQKQLDEAQKTIATLNTALPGKEQQIAGLQKQLAGVQDQLDAARKEGETNKSTIADLQKQLDTATATAKEQPPVTEDQKKLTQENDLLRGIVLRELKDQARREQSRKLVLSELDRMKVRSQALVDQISLLGQPAVQLTEAERSLFKTPQMEIIDNTPGAMSISIAAPASSPGGSSSAEGALPTQGGLPAAPNGALDSKPNAPQVATEAKAPVPAEFQETARQAKDAFNQKKYLESARLYEKIVSKAPSNVYALSNLGVAHFRAGHLKQAEETLKKVNTIAPNDAFALTTLGIIYYGQGRYDEAVTTLTQAVKSNPTSASAHNFLGVAAGKKGWAEAARKELESALQLNPSYADAHYNLAVLLSTAQPADKDAAFKHYREALDLGMRPDPKFEQSLNKK
ncbi:MAG: tetratricopeptide repeat protein [Chthoniobacteraceae bacterium]